MSPAKRNRLIQTTLAAAFVLLPLSQFRWLPNLGTTRPLSAPLFVLALGMVALVEMRSGRFAPLSPTSWQPLIQQIRSLPEWSLLRWWFVLFVMGIVSAAITPFYGAPLQALNRLLGYFLIIVYLASALFALRSYGIQPLAKWISLGYLTVLVYAGIEALAMFRLPWAYQAVMLVRNSIVVPFDWLFRLALLTTEPSFVSFQLLLLILIFPFLTHKGLRFAIAVLVVISIIFTQSGVLLLVLGTYGVSYFALKLKKRTLLKALLAGLLLVGLSWVVYQLPGVHEKLQPFIHQLSGTQRVMNIQISYKIRFYYILNLIYSLIESRGLGLGIGQYGLYWKEIYLRYIDYRAFDPTGEVERALASTAYMRPWSVIFGIGVDLGVAGMAVLLGFFYQLLRACRTPHFRAIVLAGFVALLGAYPIVTPHVWIALALAGGLSLYASVLTHGNHPPRN